MSKWNFLLFGGDLSDPHIRRMFVRVGIPSFVMGFFIGFFDLGARELADYEKAILLAMLALYAFILVFEFRRAYRCADEMLKRVMVNSLAIAGLAVTGACLFYGVLDMVFGLPEVPVLMIAIFALIAKSIAWFFAAWKYA